MTEKELKKLTRRQLLEMLIVQTERAERLQEKIDQIESSLRSRQITITESGSIAEAALKLNDVFGAAEAAASQYLESVKSQSATCEQIEEESRQKAQRMIEEAEQKCRERERMAEERIEEISDRIQQTYEQYRALNILFQNFMVDYDNE